MLRTVKSIVCNGKTYQFVKEVFTEDVNHYFGAVKRLDKAKQQTFMYLNRIDNNKTILLSRTQVDGLADGSVNSIFCSDYAKNKFICTMLDESGKVTHKIKGNCN